MKVSNYKSSQSNVVKTIRKPKHDAIIMASTTKLLQVYDVVAPPAASIFNRFHQALVRHSAEASKSKSVFPLLSQGVIQLMDVGSEIAKTRVQPLIQEIRESKGRDHLLVGSLR